MSAPLWMCFVLLMAVCCQGKPSGILEYKKVKLHPQGMAEFPRHLLEAQDAVRGLVEGAREEALQQLAAMKQKHREIIRQQFYNALDKRLFRLDILKPRPTWQKKPCRGSIISCFNIPNKSFLSRPVYSKTTYQNICDQFPPNSYMFLECIRRIVRLPTYATVRPSTKNYPLIPDEYVEKNIFYESENIANERNLQEQLTKGTYNPTLFSSTSTTSITLTSTPKSNVFDKVDKLDSHKTNLQLENEILGVDGFDKTYTLNKIYPTSTQINIIDTTEPMIAKFDPRSELAARIEPENYTSSSEKYESATDSALVESSSHIHVEEVSLTSFIPSTSITEPKELEKENENVYGTTIEHTENTTELHNEAREELNTISPLVSEDNSGTITNQIETATELHKEGREEVDSISTLMSGNISSLANPTTATNEFDIRNQVDESEIPLLGREESHGAIPSVDDPNITIGTPESLFNQTSNLLEISSTSSNTILIRNYENTVGSATTAFNVPQQSSEFSRQPSSTDETHLPTSKEGYILESNTELSETTERGTEVVESKTDYLVLSTILPTTEDVFINESHNEAVDNREQITQPRENTEYDTQFETEYPITKTDYVENVQTQSYNTEDMFSVHEHGTDRSFLDVQDKLLEQTLPDSSHVENVNYSTQTDNIVSENSTTLITQPSTTLQERTGDIRDSETQKPELINENPATNSTLRFNETTLNSTSQDKESEMAGILNNTGYLMLNITGGSNLTEHPSILSNIATLKISSNIPSATTIDGDIPFSTNKSQNTTDGIMKFTSEIESTKIDNTTDSTELSSTPEGPLLNDPPYTLEMEKGLERQREKRSEDKVLENFQDSRKSINASGDFISPTQYASTILELLPIIREGYKNNAFSDEDKKVIRSVFGEMKPWMDEESLKTVKESASDFMGDETSKQEDFGEYSDSESSDSQEMVSAGKERRMKRSKNLQLLNSALGHLPKQFQVSPLVRKSRRIRSSGTQPVAEAAAILALLAENSEGVQLDRADDDDEDEYEYYEDYENDEKASDEEFYEEEYDENPSFTELIKLARKHRERKAMV